MANSAPEQLTKKTDLEEYDLMVLGNGAGEKSAVLVLREVRKPGGRD
jgi:hypothetical protein